MKSLEHKELRNILAHRFPFLLVDRITDYDSTKAVGIKNVTATDPFLQGHFPDDPIYPGILIIESCAQVGGVMLSENENYKRIGYLAQVNDFKFLSFVIPGDTMQIFTKFESALGSFVKVTASVKVDSRKVGKGTITYSFNTKP